MLIWPLFIFLGRTLWKYFVGKFKTPKRHSEINRPLSKNNLETVEALDELEPESEVEEEEDSSPMPVFGKSHVLSPFVEIKDGREEDSESESESESDSE